MNHTQTQTVGGRSSSTFRRLTGWLIAVLGFAALAATASAQNATITGRVLNAGTGEFLKYVQIQIDGTDKVAFSEEGGVFTLPSAPAGQVKLIVTYTGLDTQEVTITVPAEGTVTQDVKLTSSEYGDTIKLGEFKVASAREGNAKAIVEQRQAMNMKTVISADAFGDVAEGNVGEFLRLLPGVTVDYVDNDVRTTRIRGLPAKYTTTTIDGHAIATAGSASITTGRQFELEQVSMTSLDTVENAKSPTPDMASAGLAGNTNAISKSAFNQKGRSIKYQANVTMNSWFLSASKSRGWDNEDHYKIFPGGQAEWVDTLMGGKLGIVLSAAHSGSFAEQQAVTTSTTFDRNPANNGSEVPLTTQIQIQDGPKPTKRDSMLLNLEYKVSDDLKFGLHTSYGYYRAEFYNRNWTINATTTSQLATYTTAGVISTPGTTVAWPDALNGALDPSYLAPGVTRTSTSANYVSQGATNTNTFVGITGSNQRKSGGTFVVSPSASWKHNDLKVDFLASYSQAKSAYVSGQDGYFSQVQANMNGISWQYDKDGDRNYHLRQTSQVTVNPVTGVAGTVNTGSIFDLANYNQNGIAYNERRNGKDQFWTTNLDVELDRSAWTIPTKFKAGIATSLNVFDIANFQPQWAVTLTNLDTTPTAINLRDYRDPLFPSTGAGFTITDIFGVTSKAPSIDKWKLYQNFLDNGNVDPFSTTANGAFKANVSANLRYMLQNQFDIKENINSAYTMATLKPTKKLSIITGLRFEKTKTEGRSFDDKGNIPTLLKLGYVMDASMLEPGTGLWAATQATAWQNAQKANTNIYWMQWRSTGTTAGTAGTTLVANTYGLKTVMPAIGTTGTQFMDYIYYRYGSRVTRTKDYNTELPSIQARYAVQKNLVARAAYYKSVLRPDFQNVVGGFTVSENTDTPNKYSFSIRNTDLKPESADNFDGSLEYYFEPVGVVSVTGFFKQIKDIQVAYSNTVDLGNLPQELIDMGYNAGNVTSDSTIGTTINGPRTSVWGVELAYSQELTFLPGAFKGLGVSANYTYIEPQEDRLWAMVPSAGDGLSKNAFNFILRYKYKKFNTQLTTTWVDKKINAISGLSIIDNSFSQGTGTGSNTFTWIRARTQVNMNFTYQIHRYATVFLNLNNVFNEPQYRYVEQEVYTNRNGQYGVAITAGVKGSF